ncbi:hypothetical protein GCM10017322_40080 [Paracoccus aerius]|nr:hypothetical protein GCM10017322_40080 [Paracoccus aerius]
MRSKDTPAEARQRFRCPACVQMMTYGRGQCENCGEVTPIYNWRGFWLGLWICLGLSAVGALAILILG